MQTSKQRHRLLRDLESEPLRTWAILAICGGGLAIIFFIALIGSGSNDNREAIARAQQAAPAAQPAEGHRRQVFDERRQRFDGNAPRNIAGQSPEAANRLAVTPQ